MHTHTKTHPHSALLSHTLLYLQPSKKLQALLFACVNEKKLVCLSFKFTFPEKVHNFRGTVDNIIKNIQHYYYWK